MQRIVRLVVIIACLTLAFLFGAPSPSQAQSSPDNCEPPKFAGITHCLEEGGKTHVLVIDLTNNNVRLETALAAYRQPIIGIPVECSDVNIPKWALVGGGCAVPGTEKYPSETVEEIVRRYSGVAAAINTDYFGPGYDHGPEGLAIKNGQRFDGWRKGDCDGTLGGKLNHDPKDPKSTPTPCQSNDVNRTSMTISRAKSVEISRKSFSEVDNPSLWSDRFYNAVGAGPLIVRQGIEVKKEEHACAKENLPDGEAACLKVSQSVVGITKDKHKLVLVTSQNQNAYAIADMLAKYYHVESAMKFDGGGSAQMMYDSKAFYGTNEKRPVVEALLVFSVPLREYDALINKQSDMAILDPGKGTRMFIDLLNSGSKTWTTREVMLVNTNGQTLGLPNLIALKGDVAPSKSYRWEFDVAAPSNQGIYSSDWQLQQAGKAFGPQVSLRITVTPDIVRNARDQFTTWLDDQIKNLERAISQFIEQKLRESLKCNSILLFMAAILTLWKSRARNS